MSRASDRGGVRAGPADRYQHPGDGSVITIQVDASKPLRLSPREGYRRAGRSNTYVVAAEAERLLKQMRSGKRARFRFEDAKGAAVDARFPLAGLSGAMGFMDKMQPAPQRRVSRAAAPPAAMPPAVDQPKPPQKPNRAGRRSGDPRTKPAPPAKEPAPARTPRRPDEESRPRLPLRLERPRNKRRRPPAPARPLAKEVTPAPTASPAPLAKEVAPAPTAARPVAKEAAPAPAAPVPLRKKPPRHPPAPREGRCRCACAACQPPAPPLRPHPRRARRDEAETGSGPDGARPPWGACAETGLRTEEQTSSSAEAGGRHDRTEREPQARRQVDPAVLLPRQRAVLDSLSTASTRATPR